VCGWPEAVLLETRRVNAALSAMTIKTDRKDVRGIAQRDVEQSVRARLLAEGRGDQQG
jgi:hypothetical protein